MRLHDKDTNFILVRQRTGKAPEAYLYSELTPVAFTSRADARRFALQMKCENEYTAVDVRSAKAKRILDSLSGRLEIINPC